MKKKKSYLVVSLLIFGRVTSLLCGGEIFMCGALRRFTANHRNLGQGDSNKMPLSVVVTPGLA